MKEFIIGKSESGQRADKYLGRILPGASKSFLYKMMRKKNIDLNGHKLEGNELLKENDVLKIWFSDETFQKFSVLPKSSNNEEYVYAYNNLHGIKVVYEDDNIIILDKPFGILSQKASDSDVSLNEWLIGYLLKEGKIEQKDLSFYKPSVQNRLDRNTTGLVLCAKTVKGASSLSDMIKERSVKKYYQALVLGTVSEEGTLIGYHYKDPTKNKAYIITENEYLKLSENDKGKYSKVITRYKPLKGIKLKKSNIDASFIEVELVTGKSHQIRAHMASIGHPLINDRKYCNKTEQITDDIPHYLLHAYKVIFPADSCSLNLSEKEITSKTNITENL